MEYVMSWMSFFIYIYFNSTLPFFFYMLRYVFLGVKENGFNMKWRWRPVQFGSQIQMNFVINRILTNTKMTNTATFCWSHASISDKTKRLMWQKLLFSSGSHVLHGRKHVCMSQAVGYSDNIMFPYRQKLITL